MVNFNASEAQLSTCLFTKSSMDWLWHRRLGNVGIKQLNRLAKHDLVRGLKDVVFEKDKLRTLVKPTNKLETPILRKA